MKKRIKVPTRTSPSEDSLFDNAVDLGDMPDEGLKALIFGGPGTGKTTLAASITRILQKGQKLMFVRPEEVEDGTISIRGMPNIKVTPPVKDPDQIMDLCDHLAREEIFGAVLLDGLGRFADMVIKKQCDLQDVPVQYTWGMVKEADWNRIGITMKSFMRELLRLTKQGKHVIFVGDEREFEPTGESEVMTPCVTVALTPSLVSWVHGVCDYNLHTFTKEKTEIKKVKIAGKIVEKKVSVPGEIDFCIHAKKHSYYATKFKVPPDRRDKVPSVIVNPTFSKIMRIIRGEKE